VDNLSTITTKNGEGNQVWELKKRYNMPIRKHKLYLLNNHTLKTYESEQSMSIKRIVLISG